MRLVMVPNIATMMITWNFSDLSVVHPWQHSEPRVTGSCTCVNLACFCVIHCSFIKTMFSVLAFIQIDCSYIQVSPFKCVTSRWGWEEERQGGTLGIGGCAQLHFKFFTYRALVTYSNPFYQIWELHRSWWASRENSVGHVLSCSQR